MKNLKVSFLFALSFVGISLVEPTVAQTKVEVNFNTTHKVGEVTNFDRPKFINFHATTDEQYWDSGNSFDNLKYDLLVGYDVYVGRETGVIKSALNSVKEDSSRPGYADPEDLARIGKEQREEYASRTELHPYEKYSNLIVCNQFSPFYPDGVKTRDGGWALSQADTKNEPYGTASGEFYGRYIKEAFGEGGTTGEAAPGFCEVINEPLWDIYDMPNAPKSSIEKLFRFHTTVANEVRKYNPEMQVGGYCTAFPDFEVDNFDRWRKRWMSFIDIAGKDMDFFTIHLYDFPCKDGKQIYRKGSNMEATMDMIEQYSMLKLGEVKPLMISEYSAQTHDYNDKWSPYRDWLRLVSTNSMVLQFMERANNINYAMPFTMLRSDWGYNPELDKAHTARLLRRENEPESFTGDYVYSELVKFYQQWKDIKGSRVESHTNNLDIMCDAYVDGNRSYLIINNLEFESIELDLAINGMSGNPTDIEVRYLHLVGGENGCVNLDVYKTDKLDKLIIAPEATYVICYTFDSDVKIDNSMVETKYYATDYLQPIKEGESIEFDLNGVELGEHGEAVLRVGVGREHNTSLSPVVKVNGEEVALPGNIRGDNQEDRATFFGVMEIPFDYSLLRKNNRVEVEFPDSGGYVSTVTMQVFDYEKPL